MTDHAQRAREISLADTIAAKIWHARTCEPGECICNLICRGDLDDISAEFDIAAALAQATREAVTGERERCAMVANEMAKKEAGKNITDTDEESDSRKATAWMMAQVAAEIRQGKPAKAAQPVWSKDKPTELRRCLKCEHWMHSTGADHRICNPCKGEPFVRGIAGRRVKG